MNQAGNTTTAVIQNPTTGHYEVYTGPRNGNPTFTDNLSVKDQTRTKTYNPQTQTVSESPYGDNPSPVS